MLIKKWDELTERELGQIEKSRSKEWQNSTMTPEHHQFNTFFLLKDDKDQILAQGQLVPIDGVEFDDQAYDIYGIGGIIADVKGQGYGKMIILAIKEYLKEKNKSGVGFTGLPDFYRKCGYHVTGEAIKRFVHAIGGKKILNNEDDHICYLDASDRFMENVIKSPEKLVYLPRNPDW